MLGNLGSSSDATTATATAVEPFGAHEGGGGDGGVGSNSGEEEKNSYSRGGDEFGDRSFGGNRWPRQETLALLKIRSDMDVAFRDASVKGPLWDEVSRSVADINTNFFASILVLFVSGDFFQLVNFGFMWLRS